MAAKIWTYTASNPSLVHAFKDGHGHCNKGIRPRTGPDFANPSGPFVATYITIEQATESPVTNICGRCRTKVNSASTGAPTVVAKELAMKDENLTGVMIYAIGAIGRRNISLVRMGTIVALIERGILTTAGAETRGRHLLTDKGVDLFRLFAETDPELETVESHVIANTTVYKVGDKVASVRRDNGLGIGTVTDTNVGQYGQVVYVKWAGSSVPYPVKGDSLVPHVEPERNESDGLCCVATGHDWTCANRVRHVYTAKMVERDESEEFMARHPEETAPEMNLMGQHRKHPYVTVTEHWKRMTDRDKLARSVAYEFSHRFLTWGINDPQPEQPIVPRDLDRMRMFQFYQDGSIPDPGQLLAEIRNEMTDQAMAFADAQVTTGSVMTSRMDAVNAMLWLGWLNGYILECGAVDSDGWQNRVRGPQDGWEGLGLYSTEPSDATELPAWADPEDNESFGCVAVISPQGRYSDAENCGDGITREEYHAHGSEFGMCEQHRLAKIAADDKGW